MISNACWSLRFREALPLDSFVAISALEVLPLPKYRSALIVYVLRRDFAVSSDGRGSPRLMERICLRKSGMLRVFGTYLRGIFLPSSRSACLIISSLVAIYRRIS